MNASTALVSTVLLLALFVPSPAMAGAPRGEDPESGSPDAAPDFDLPAVQLRIAIGRALGEHAFLVIEAMRTSSQPGPDFDAAAAVLDENTAEIEDLVSGVLTPEGARAFGQQWRNHVAYLVDYARAVAAGDDDASQLAEDQLQTYADEFSTLLVDAFPNLPMHAVEELVGEHASQVQQVTDLAGGDYEAAYLAIRETYAHMFAIGDGLTIGILGQGGDTAEGREVALSPAVDFRMTLDRLFGEHTYLAATVMRAAFNRDAHRDAAVEALEHNSDELAEQVSTIYGDEAGDAFARLWARHTTLYIQYVEATAEGDQAQQEEALAGLASYRSDFSAFLADANPLLDRAGLEMLLETHTNHLVEQVTAYADEEYDQAYHMLRDAYAQTEELAAGLAGAIADQFPQRFPDTAMSAIHPHDPAHPRPDAIGVLCLAAAVAVLVRRSIDTRRNGASDRRGWLPSWSWGMTRSIR